VICDTRFEVAAKVDEQRRPEGLRRVFLAQRLPLADARRTPGGERSGVDA
jgi:hypothetical protein